MLKSAHHGGLDYAALRAKGISPEEVLDFSVNVNPFGPPPAVQETLARVAIARYPDTRAGALGERLGAINGVLPEEVLVTNGLSQAIWLLAGLGMQVFWIMLGILFVNIVWRLGIRRYSAVGN